MAHEMHYSVSKQIVKKEDYKMVLKKDEHLTDSEKNIIAMGAAMGGGCRTCAEKLHTIATSLEISEEDMLKAFEAGLDAKAQAIRTMKEKVACLLGKEKTSAAESNSKFSEKLDNLIRMASFVAANSAPDFISEMKKACKKGITPEQIKLCISLAKMVRKNAAGFSDQEIGETQGGEEAGKSTICCPLSPNEDQSSGCSCG
jgi:alkylhydroperoxidase/carboxymuconolactone decarboxylase family protein YurZ